jgi:thiamine kinase-like enzyme
LPKITHPKNISQITKEWVEYIFNEAGLCNTGTIENINIEPMGTDVKGFLSSMCRIEIKYKTEDPNLPPSVVIKMPPEQEMNREFAINLRANEREIRFYKELAPLTPIQIPICIYGYINEASGDYILVLEDEKEWTPGDQVAGLTELQTKIAVGAISKFHGKWWQSPQLEKLSWMPQQNRDLAYGYKNNWGEFKNEHSEILDEDGVKAGDVIKESGNKITELSLKAPQTITHMDFRADNLLFKNEDQVLVLDWQVACRTIGAFDVARVVCASYHDHKTREEHTNFVELWHQGLIKSGVNNYSFEDAWRDYRVGILILSYVPVTAHHLLSHEGSRGPALLQAIIHRVYHAINETDALELLK